MSEYLRNYVHIMHLENNALSYSVPSKASVASIAACLTLYSNTKPLLWVGQVEIAESTQSTTKHTMCMSVPAHYLESSCKIFVRTKLMSGWQA